MLRLSTARRSGSCQDVSPERRSVRRVTLAPDLEEHAMRWFCMSCVLIVGAGLVSNAAAQATGLPSFNAPYRAFRRSEIGLVLSIPNGGGTAFEGAYRLSSGKFDIGFRGGIFTPGGNLNSRLLLGAEARERVVTHTEDFPLDGALILGIGAQLSSGTS